MSLERDTSLDIAKGLLIILVVLGHSTFPYTDIIYWFHMPAFFIISGILYKENSLKIAKLVFALFIPFVTFIIINVLVRYFTNPDFNGIDDLLLLFYKHIYNGKIIGGVYWYIPVFFLTKIVFDLAKKFFKKYIWIIMLLSYVLAHIISLTLIPSKDNYTNPNLTLVLPWDIDVVLIAVWYYYLGVLINKYGKNIYKNINFIAALFLCCIVFICTNYFTDMQYFLDMKYSYYKSIVLDTLIPIIFTLFILGISSVLSKIDFKFGLSFIGQKSLFIMFLHIPLCANILQIQNYLAFTIIGVSIPLVVAILVEKNKYTKFLVSGKLVK